MSLSLFNIVIFAWQNQKMLGSWQYEKEKS